MKNKIDKILLGLLWLLAITLGTSFWFNTNFGFNIFAAQHWQYLAYMQASQTPVTPMFYISLVLAILIAIAGLYILLRPGFRKIKLPIIRTNEHTPKHKKQTPENIKNPENHAHTDSTPINETASTLDILSPEQTPAPIVPPTPTLPRPPRLKMPMTNNYIAPGPGQTQSTSNTNTLVTNAPTITDMPEVREIFRDTGYTVKQSPKINGIQTTLLAIGVNETLWIGAVGVKTTDMRRAIDTLSSIFSDTLDDIEILINGFVLNAPDAATSEFQDILMFDSPDQLRTYMNEHQNPALSPDEQENFDAYSEYIDTVITYIGKM